jgi:rod shape-determining protein MreD
MRVRRKRTIVKVLRYALFLLVLYILQGLIFSHFKIFGSVPMLFPMAVAGVALFAGSITGGTFGLFAGILCDISLNQPAVIFTVTFAVLGLLIGSLSESVITRSLVSYCILSVLCLALTAFFQMFSLLFFAGQSPSLLVRTAVIQTLVSLIFLFPIYFCLRPVIRRN